MWRQLRQQRTATAGRNLIYTNFICLFDGNVSLGDATRANTELLMHGALALRRQMPVAKNRGNALTLGR